MAKVVSVVFLGLCWFSVANAAGVQSAKAHFDEAQKHFAVGEFHEAGEEYQLAYKAKPDPALLYDAATAFRLANEPERAIVLYRNYLQFYPNQPNAADVRNVVEQLREGIAAAARAKDTPPKEPLKPAPAVEEPKVAEATPAPTVVAVAPEPAPERRGTPVYKRWWLWTIVGVVVVGAAAGVAVALTVPSHPWANGPTVGPGAASTSALRMAEVRW